MTYQPGAGGVNCSGLILTVPDWNLLRMLRKSRPKGRILRRTESRFRPRPSGT